MTSAWISAQKTVSHYQHFTTDNGLSANEVLAGLQDYRGFLWFGTRNGLNRFDGVHFDLFERSKGMQADRVVQLAEDKDHWLWIVHGVDEGILRCNGMIDAMNLATGEVMPLEKHLPNIPFSTKDILWIEPNGYGEVYIVVKAFKFYKYSIDKGFELKYSYKAADPNNIRSLDITYQAKGDCFKIWDGDYCASLKGRLISVKTKNDLQFSRMGDDFFEYFYIHNINNRPEYAVEKHFADGHMEEGTILLPEERQMTNEDVGYVTFTYDNFRSSMIVSTRDKSYLYNGTAFEKLLDKSFSLTTVFSYFTDQQGGHWLCASDGIHHIFQTKEVFHTLFKSGEAETNINGNQIRAIWADTAGNVWCSAFQWLYRYDKKGRLYRHQQSPSNGEHLCFVDFGENLFGFGTEERVTTIAKNSFATKLIYNNSKSIYKSTFNDTLGIRWSAYPLGPQKFIVGCEHGIGIWDLDKRTIQSLSYTAQGFVKPNFIYSIIWDTSRQCYWAGGASGLYRISKDLIITEYYGNNKALPSNKLLFSHFHDIYLDKDGSLWLASNGQGLLHFDPISKKAEVIDTKLGMPSNVLYCLEDDDYGNLWISTDKGLVQYDTSRRLLNIYSMKDGLSQNEFNRVSKFKASDGTLYFGSIDGLTTFHPKDLAEFETQNQRPMEVTSFTQFVAGADSLENHLGQLLKDKIIYIRPVDKFTEIQFALLDYQNPALRYSYKIEGLDKDWSLITEGHIRLSGLPYGQFKLRVRAQSYNGTWAKNELYYPIVVIKPYYLQWWFMALIVAILVSSIYLLIKYRTSSFKKANLALEQTVNERTHELIEALSERELLLKEIHHRVKNNLQVISGLFTLQQINLESETSRNAFEIAKSRLHSVALIHEVLYQNENLKEVDLHELCLRLFDQVDAVFKENLAPVKLTLKGDKLFFNLNTTISLGLMVNEMLTNSYKYAFKHQSSPEITITLKNNPDTALPYTLIYQDNGVGLPDDFDPKKSKSLGTVIIMDLSRQLKGKVVFGNESGIRIQLDFIGIKG